MLPLFVLTLFIYYAVLELLLRLNNHFLVRSGYHSSSDEAIALALRSGHQGLYRVIAFDAEGPLGARRHFKEVRAEYLPVIDRRIHFLSILITTGPLLGLLGTVTGMIQVFQQITVFGAGDPTIMAGGISSALMTTVLGIVVAIPTIFMHTVVKSRADNIIHILEEQATGMIAQKAEQQAAG